MAVQKAKKKAQSKPEEELRQGLGDFVSICPELDGVDVRMFLYLFTRLKFTEFVHVPQIEMAVMLGKRQGHVSRSLKKLVDVGVLLPGPEGTRASKWMLNPDYGT